MFTQQVFDELIHFTKAVLLGKKQIQWEVWSPIKHDNDRPPGN